ncbi:MAG: HPF/RaiA family ribosome-associated protein [Bacteroidales bacterium]
MEIRIQSLKFDADVKLIDFIEKKLSKLTKFYDPIQSVEVTLSLRPDYLNKNVLIKLTVPRHNEIVIERQGTKFEDAVVDSIPLLKDQLIKIKEKREQAR